ncbi:putative ankyrin repeat and LEM domain-containing protein 1 [Penaeus vannamei]|uniref:Putative ankyrin repeat and LEM domain-containing protein 1 n=1 Tax=Penaeus vannamei TaxID=6689 RepID=A0A3R7MKR2_PENVA|nr:putative ankyrin repeat and LEM domain-containing protein 1 [Penaeus vannamei]
MEESFSTRYSQFLRDLENYEQHQIDTDEDGWKSTPQEPKLNDSGPSRIHCPDFLKKLKQTIQKYQHDSDSDSDIVSLQRCLEKNLNEASRSFCRASSFASFTSEDKSVSSHPSLALHDPTKGLWAREHPPLVVPVSHSSALWKSFSTKILKAGIALIERRCPSSSSIARRELKFHWNGNSIKALSAETLRARLKAVGYTPGPITAGTHRVYQRHLMRIRKNPQMLKEENADSAKPSYPRELKMALEDPSSVDWISWGSLERVMSSPFCQPDPMRHWRDGTTKSCFNYLLLDPRITQDLPLRIEGRPYYHLYEAIKSLENGKKKNKKIERIHDIWSEGVGVISLHVFQNTIPVEAWTREAAMITAIGLGNLSNSIQGTFYGLPSTWRWAERRRLGTHLLWRTLQIFLQEGERQLRPSDVTLPVWMK